MSLACAWHCIPTCPLYSNAQRDKALQWHATWLPALRSAPKTEGFKEGT